MSSSFTNLSHPYGVMPSGNSFLATQKQLNVRVKGLGYLRQFTDDWLISMLSFLNERDMVIENTHSRLKLCIKNQLTLLKSFLSIDEGPDGTVQSHIIRLLPQC